MCVNEGIRRVKVDAGIEFCECCHIFGNETLIQIPLIQLAAPITPNQKKFVYLCDECITEAYIIPKED